MCWIWAFEAKVAKKNARGRHRFSSTLSLRDNVGGADTNWWAFNRSFFYFPLRFLKFSSPCLIPLYTRTLSYNTHVRSFAVRKAIEIGLRFAKKWLRITEIFPLMLSRDIIFCWPFVSKSNKGLIFVFTCFVLYSIFLHPLSIHWHAKHILERSAPLNVRVGDKIFETELIRPFTQNPVWTHCRSPAILSSWRKSPSSRVVFLTPHLSQAGFSSARNFTSLVFVEQLDSSNRCWTASDSNLVEVDMSPSNSQSLKPVWDVFDNLLFAKPRLCFAWVSIISTILVIFNFQVMTDDSRKWQNSVIERSFHLTLLKNESSKNIPMKPLRL